jgi:Holliday junction resolvase
MNKNPRETAAERKFVKHVEEDGNVAIKLNLHGRRGWPDRLVVIENGRCFFLEFKRKGVKIGKRKGEKLQLYIHKELMEKGHAIYSVDDCEEAIKIYEKEKALAAKMESAKTRRRKVRSS